MVQIASVALIGVDVNLQLGILVLTDQQIFKGHRTLGTLDLEGHKLAVFDAVVSAIAGVDMHMPSRPDHSLVQLDGSGWTDQNATRGSLDVTAVSDRSVDPQRDRIGESQLNLTGLARRPQYPNVGDHATTRPNDHDRFGRREKSVLVQVLLGGQFLPLSKELLDMLVSQVNVPCRNAHDKLRDVKIRRRSFRRGGSSRNPHGIGDGRTDQGLDTAVIEVTGVSIRSGSIHDMEFEWVS